MTEHPAVYRAPMWSRLDEVDRAAAVTWALDEGVCGVGGRLEVAPSNLHDAVEKVASRWDERMAARLRRFADAEDGSLVWTRDGDGFFHLGTLLGAWRHSRLSDAFVHDLTHVRDCDWSAGPVDPPPAVVASFARGGRNFQRIRAAEATPGGHPERG